MLKYLFGGMFDVNGDCYEGVALTWKRDSFQHQDMARETRMNVLQGGFTDFDTTNGTITNFHGESISCRVDSSHSRSQDTIAKIMAEGKGYKIEFEDDSIPVVLLFVDKDVQVEADIGWKSVTPITDRKQIADEIADCVNWRGRF